MKEATSQRDTSRYHVPNLERALAIFEHLADRPGGSTMTDVANALDFPKNSVFRILSTLHAYDYVVRDEHTQNFRLNGKLLGLGYRGTGADQLVESSGDILRSLRDASGETAFIGRLIDHGGVVLAQVPSRQPIKVAVDPGTRFPLYSSAPGKAMLAWMPEDECEELIRTLSFTRFTKRTIGGIAAFRKALATTRTRGFAVDWGEEVDGINCVGAPILDHAGHAVAAVWVSGPDTRVEHGRFDAYGTIVLNSAAEVSRRLGFTGKYTGGQ